MRFNLSLQLLDLPGVIPINYQYPFSSVVYKILNKADSEYAQFLHNEGYKDHTTLKTFKFFTFSDLTGKFQVDKDRLLLMDPNPSIQISFHLPDAAGKFIKGVFKNQQIEIADVKSKSRFLITSVNSLISPFGSQNDEKQIVSVHLRNISPIVAGMPNDKGHYSFLEPSDPEFAKSLLYNWRSKIASLFGPQLAQNAKISIKIIEGNKQFRSKLITIKAFSKEETKIRGWNHIHFQAEGEVRFVSLLYNSGAGLYNSLGCGCIEIN